jgi:hypothetical protein
VLGTLLTFTAWLLVVAIATLVVALLSGPYPWAVRLRGWVRDLGRSLSGAVARGERAPAAAWIGAHRDALMLGGAALFVVVLLVTELSMWGFLLTALLLAAYELIVYRLGVPAASA